MDLDNTKKNKSKINDSDAFICIKCNFSSNHPSIWLAHSKTKKHQNNILDIEKPKQEFYCECCDIKFLHLSNWNMHINSEKHKRQGKPKSIECVECNRQFINHITQRHHMLSTHSTKEERAKQKYYCGTCDYVFISKLYMDKHIQGKFHISKVKAIESFEQMKQIQK